MSILISLLVLVLIFALVWWVLDQIPLPAPFGMIVRVIVGVIMIVYLLNLTGTLHL